jgi:hypothetical protein
MKEEFKYIVYCWEVGYPPDNPYHKTDDISEAISVCESIGTRYFSKAYVRNVHIPIDFPFRDRFVIVGHKLEREH